MNNDRTRETRTAEKWQPCPSFSVAKIMEFPMGDVNTMEVKWA